MKFALAALTVAASAVVAQGIADLPPCMLTCAASNMAKAEGCGPTDFACLCKSEPFMTGLISCAEGSCSPEDLAKKDTLLASLCPGGAATGGAGGAATSAPASESAAATSAAESAASSASEATSAASESAASATSVLESAASSASGAVASATGAVKPTGGVVGGTNGTTNGTSTNGTKPSGAPNSTASAPATTSKPSAAGLRSELGFAAVVGGLLASALLL